MKIVPRYTTVADAAKHLRCSPSAVRRRIRSGRLPHINLNGPGERPYYRVPLSALRRG